MAQPSPRMLDPLHSLVDGAEAWRVFWLRPWGQHTSLYSHSITETIMWHI